MATRKRQEVPVYYVEMGAPQGFEEGEPYSNPRYTVSSKANLRYPNKVDEIMVKIFVNAVSNHGKEPDEVLIMRYGIAYRPINGVWDDEFMEPVIQKLLEQYRGASIHVVEEEGTFSIRVNLGSKDEGSKIGDVETDLRKHKQLLGELYTEILKEYKDLDWFVFFDTEVALTDSV